MKAKIAVNELRIGVYIESMGETLRVNIIDETVINLLKAGLYQPIPLTDQWLKDFKIKKIKVSGWVAEGATYWEKYGIIFYERQGKYYMSIGENLKKAGHEAIMFDKVHELQNIFALTGKELTK